MTLDGGVDLQAAAQLAAARAAVVGIHAQLADFTRAAQPTAVDLPIDHDAAAHAGPDRRQEEVAIRAPGAQARFGQGMTVHVVVHAHRHAQAGGQPFAQGEANPPRQVEGGVAHPPRCAVDLARAGNARTAGRRSPRKLGMEVSQHAPPKGHDALRYGFRSGCRLGLDFPAAGDGADRAKDACCDFRATYVKD